MQMKLKKNWNGLVPEYFPEIINFIDKNFELKNIEKKYPILINSSLDKDEQVNLIIKIVFSLARQIPSDWKKNNLNKIIDPYIILYLREFIWDCFLNYYEMVHEEEDDTYDNHFFDILKILDKLYETKDSFQISCKLIYDKKFENKYGIKSKIYKTARLASATDSKKIININAKKSSEIFPLNWDEILHGTKKSKKQCHMLKDYISAKFIK